MKVSDVCRDTSLIRNSNPPQDHHEALDIGLLQGPGCRLFLMSKVPLWFARRQSADVEHNNLTYVWVCTQAQLLCRCIAGRRIGVVNRLSRVSPTAEGSRVITMQCSKQMIKMFWQTIFETKSCFVCRREELFLDHWGLKILTEGGSGLSLRYSGKVTRTRALGVHSAYRILDH